MHIPSYITNKKLLAWVEEMVALCKPDQIHWCDGSQVEYDHLCEQMVASGTFQLPSPLRPQRCRPYRRPHLYLLPKQDRRWPNQQLG